MRTTTITLAALLALGTAAAHANVWDEAIRSAAPDAAQATYDAKMREGDEHAMLAGTKSVTYAEQKNQINLAVAAYREAAAAKPQVGEPYFRIGTLIDAFYTDCDERRRFSLLCSPKTLNRSRAEEVIAAWDAFEAREPLDPRLSVSPFGSTDILFHRAILHTKLSSKAHLEAAARDYEKILARQDTGSDGVSEEVVGNLAETYMMLGRLEESIETYKHALRGASTTSTWYGYAVALDRDERSQQAIDVIASLGPSQRDDFHANVIAGRTFFVPEGEKFYYFALVDEALGFEDEAIVYWRQFVTSGAHPQYQARAKAHLEALLKKKKARPAPIEPPWRDILR